MDPAPRLSPVPPKEWPPAMRDALAPLMPPAGAAAPEGRPKGLNVLGTFAHHPALTAAFLTFNGHVLHATTLSPRMRELLVLRVASRRDAEYEWAQHVLLAGDAGLGAHEVARTREGPDSPGWSRLDAALLRAADDLVDDATIGDAAYAVLAAELDAQQLIDVVFTVGAYETVAMFMRTFGIQLEDDLRAAIS